jgi:hypothetical protein
MSTERRERKLCGNRQNEGVKEKLKKNEIRERKENKINYMDHEELTPNAKEVENSPDKGQQASNSKNHTKLNADEMKKKISGEY